MEGGRREMKSKKLSRKQAWHILVVDKIDVLRKSKSNLDTTVEQMEAIEYGKPDQKDINLCAYMSLMTAYAIKQCEEYAEDLNETH
jgi:hypothetical protein